MTKWTTIFMVINKPRFFNIFQFKLWFDAVVDPELFHGIVTRHASLITHPKALFFFFFSQIWCWGFHGSGSFQRNWPWICEFFTLSTFPIFSKFYLFIILLFCSLYVIDNSVLIILCCYLNHSFSITCENWSCFTFTICIRVLGLEIVFV